MSGTHAPIKTPRAIEIAKGWMSASVHDDQITRLAHGMVIEDWERLQAQVERNIDELAPTAEGAEALNELGDLLAWVIFKKRSVGGIKT